MLVLASRHAVLFATHSRMTTPTPLHRPEFEAALRALARASEKMRERGFLSPVLVGGAAVELYTGSAITTLTESVATVARSICVPGRSRHAGSGADPIRPSSGCRSCLS